VKGREKGKEGDGNGEGKKGREGRGRTTCISHTAVVTYRSSKCMIVTYRVFALFEHKDNFKKSAT